MDKDIKLIDKDGNEIKTAYIEPADYFPEEIRKKCKLGEYNEDPEDGKEN